MLSKAKEARSGVSPSEDSDRRFDPSDERVLTEDEEQYWEEVGFAWKAGVAITGDGDIGLLALSDVIARLKAGERRLVERGGRGYFRTAVQNRIRDIARGTVWRETSLDANDRRDGDTREAEDVIASPRLGAVWQPDLAEAEETLLRSVQTRETGKTLARAIEAQDPRTRMALKAWLRKEIRTRVVEKGSADDFETLVEEIERAWEIDLGEITGAEELARVMNDTRDNVYVWQHRGLKKVLAEVAGGGRRAAAR